MVKILTWGRGYQKRPKNSNVFYGRPLTSLHRFKMYASKCTKVKCLPARSMPILGTWTATWRKSSNTCGKGLYVFWYCLTMACRYCSNWFFLVSRTFTVLFRSFLGGNAHGNRHLFRSCWKKIRELIRKLINEYLCYALVLPYT